MGNDWGLQHSGGESRGIGTDSGTSDRKKTAVLMWGPRALGRQRGREGRADRSHRLPLRGGSGVVGKQQHGTGRQKAQGKFLLRYFMWQSLDPSASASNPGPTKAPGKTNHNKCVCVKFISKQSRVASSAPVFISHQKPCIRFTLTPGTPTASFLLGSPPNLPAGPGRCQALPSRRKSAGHFFCSQMHLS